MRTPLRSAKAIPLLLASLLASCEPMVIVERDATARIAEGATWSWSIPDADGLAPEQGDVAPTEPVARAIAAAIEAELTQRGYRRTSVDSAAFVVHFHLGRREVVDTVAAPTRNPGTVTDRDPQSWGHYGSPETMGTRTVTWQEGMLIIDALTVADGKLAWRGVIVGEIKPSTQNETTAAIEAAVARLIAKFP
jgi:hypothetical protein